MPPDLAPWLNVVKDIGGYGALTLVLWGLKGRWWVPGWVYDDALKACDEASKKLEADRDWWRNKFMAVMETLEHTSQ